MHPLKKGEKTHIKNIQTQDQILIFSLKIC